MDGLEAKAKASGASQLVVKDLKEEFVKDYVFPCLRAGAIYERKYLLGTSMARPVIAKVLRLEVWYFISTCKTFLLVNMYTQHFRLKVCPVSNTCQCLTLTLAHVFIFSFFHSSNNNRLTCQCYVRCPCHCFIVVVIDDDSGTYLSPCLWLLYWLIRADW